MILWGRLMRSFSSAVFFDIIILLTVFLFIVIPVFYSIYINLNVLASHEHYQQ